MAATKLVGYPFQMTIWMIAGGGTNTDESKVVVAHLQHPGAYVNMRCLVTSFDNIYYAELKVPVCYAMLMQV